MNRRAESGPLPSYRTLPVNRAPLPIMKGHQEIARRVLQAVQGKSRALIVTDGFEGARWDAWSKGFSGALRAAGWAVTAIDCGRALRRGDAAQEAVLQFHLTDEPVFGRIYRGKIQDFFDPAKLRALQQDIQLATGVVLLYGPGSTVVAGGGDCLVYLDVSKEVFQNRCRERSVTNFACDQPASFGEMYKRAFYVNWPVLNLEKRRLLPLLDILVDETDPALPKACTGSDLRKALREVAQAPVRVKPFFLPGPWGGQWMMENFGLPPGPPNYAWSYELIAPENGILVGSDPDWMEVSFDYLVWQEADALLGPAVTAVYGSAFPIRFDYLDTMQGTNLSCQVHPRVDYIREEFGEPFTQHESYYVMQAEPGARVYLGLREDTDPIAFRKAAEQAEREGRAFEINQFVHSMPSAPHDLFLIPAGTVHCSGAGNLVLEISATPYIYTFKIYDYLRKDLDGNLRHVFIDRAFANIDFTRRSRWVGDNLKQAPRRLRGDSKTAEYAIGILDQLTYSVHRLEFEREIRDSGHGRFLVLNLVGGELAEIEHARGATELRYAETIILPAALGDYRLVNRGATACKVVKAFIR
jgi:mannose-6-phosphate isomerase class I